jgi:hypothetical protein
VSPSSLQMNSIIADTRHLLLLRLLIIAQVLCLPAYQAVSTSSQKVACSVGAKLLLAAMNLGHIQRCWPC